MTPTPENLSTDDLDAFLGWPVTDQSAWLIAQLLHLIAARWEDHHSAQIMRYLNDRRPPPRDPEQPWR